jgi:hypothetical protein
MKALKNEKQLIVVSQKITIILYLDMTNLKHFYFKIGLSRKAM